ncbi:MAG TPA: DNA polymerase III subunit delta [Dehalococcoidia bacterium]|nr:DNA polymerase III subunit delta [Dehalococcoidia bacterium]
MILFLLGPEDFLREERLAMIRAEVPAEEREASLVELPAAGLTPDLLAANAQALPFFSTRRVVVVRGLLSRAGRRDAGASDRGQWEAYAAALDGTPETTTVVFVEPDVIADTQPLLKRRRPHWRIERFATPRPQDLPVWVRKRAQAQRISITPPAVQHLAEAIGPQLRLLALELDKLAAYAGDRPIGPNDVRELVSEARSESIFALSDALLGGRRRQAIDHLRRLLDEGTDPHQILAILAGQLRVAVHVRRSTARGQRAPDLRGALGLSPRYPLDKAWGQASQHSADALERAYRELLEIDWAAKTGRGELTTALDLFVLHGPLAGR